MVKVPSFLCAGVGLPVAVCFYSCRLSHPWQGWSLSLMNKWIQRSHIIPYINLFFFFILSVAVTEKLFGPINYQEENVGDENLLSCLKMYFYFLFFNIIISVVKVERIYRISLSDDSHACSRKGVPCRSPHLKSSSSHMLKKKKIGYWLFFF